MLYGENNMNTFKKNIAIISAIFFGIITIFWSRTFLFFVPAIFCLLSVLSVLKVSNIGAEKIKTVKIIGIILFIFLGIYCWRYNYCSPSYAVNADYTIDPVYEKARMKSCMAFGIYKNTVIPEWIKNPQP